MNRLNHEFHRTIGQMITNSPAKNKIITEHNVFQEGNPTNRPLMKQIINQLILPGSTVRGFDNLVDLYDRAQRGADCLMLMEHYSNFDIPCFYELLDRRGEIGEKITDSIVSMAGIKLNEESDLVRSFTEIFTRVVIFPSRSLDKVADPDKRRLAQARKDRINRAAFKELYRLKRSGRIINVYPTGTRYRPWDPSTGKGVREVESYVRYFKWMVLVAVNGNTLVINPSDSMDEDIPTQDVIIYTVSPVYSCREYRNKAATTLDPGGDAKQHVMDTIMDGLKELHEQTEIERLALPERAKPIP